jgi:hypothetical protein
MAVALKHPSRSRTIAFSDTTQCQYYEVLKWQDSLEAQSSQGSLDDRSLPGWLRNVGRVRTT